jgi:hypothetical protein
MEPPFKCDKFYTSLNFQVPDIYLFVEGLLIRSTSDKAITGLDFGHIPSANHAGRGHPQPGFGQF